ncbi:hypothetical protein [Acuticoccus kandeliae]|uniref:hypothetical protein n=1 Tax=Acuticoccus kandeliae TaxID=2073160 RepID=UPI000D3E4C47|nr:hypothetical protein [Acuticoccus kandeliae]
MIRLVAAILAGLLVLSSPAAFAQSPEQFALNRCENPVIQTVRRQLGARFRVEFLSNTLRVERLSNVENRLRGRGQYELQNRTFSRFSFVCSVNTRNGSVFDITVIQR